MAFGLASPAELASACFVTVLQTIIAFLHSHLADHKSLSHSEFHIVLINSNHHFTSSLHPLSPILRCRLLHFGLQLEQWQSLHVVSELLKDRIRVVEMNQQCLDFEREYSSFGFCNL